MTAKRSLTHFKANFRELFNHAKTLLELVNASAGINELLLAGIEGVALGADFYVDITDYGVGFHSSTASATDDCALAFGMNSSFHFLHLFSLVFFNLLYYSILFSVLQEVLQTFSIFLFYNFFLPFA